MIKPDFDGGGIVNLMTSLTLGLGGEPGPYAAASALNPDEVAAARNVMLVIIDGLGDHFFNAHEGPLGSWRRGRLSSVFPSSTAPAISSIVTGVGPEQHAVTGWHMSFREAGMVVKTLPFVPRIGGPQLTELGVDPRLMLCRPSLFDRLPVSVTQVMPAHILNSPYNRTAAGGAQGIGYRDYAQFLATCTKLVRRNRERQFIYAYWPELDSLAHQHGIGSHQAQDHWRMLARGLLRLQDQLAGSDTLLLVSADHGFLDIRPESVVELSQHPVMSECLSQPLCGEPRSTFCYVHPGRTRDFEQYVNEHLSHAFELHASEELLVGGWFGHGAPSEQIHSRIGDYTLMPREDYVIHESLGSESGWPGMIGVHGGSSEAEMYVPLLVQHC